MLEIVIQGEELWDEEKEEFIKTKPQILRLEHSLVSLSKWESKWCKPFLTNKAKTAEESIDYIKCMTISQNVKPEVYACLTKEQIKEIWDYVDLPMTATTFPNKKNKVFNKEQITSELIYYWMISSNIPFECQKWHLNRLMALIKLCNVKNQPPEKMSERELMSRNTALNAARRKRMHSKG